MRMLLVLAIAVLNTVACGSDLGDDRPTVPFEESSLQASYYISDTGCDGDCDDVGWLPDGVSLLKDNIRARRDCGDGWAIFAFSYFVEDARWSCLEIMPEAGLLLMPDNLQDARAGSALVGPVTFRHVGGYVFTTVATMRDDRHSARVLITIEKQP